MGPEASPSFAQPASSYGLMVGLSSSAPASGECTHSCGCPVRGAQPGERSSRLHGKECPVARRSVRAPLRAVFSACRAMDSMALLPRGRVISFGISIFPIGYRGSIACSLGPPITRPGFQNYRVALQRVQLRLNFQSALQFGSGAPPSRAQSTINCRFPPLYPQARAGIKYREQFECITCHYRQRLRGPYRRDLCRARQSEASGH